MEKSTSINSVIRSFGSRPAKKRFYNVILDGKAVCGIISWNDAAANEWVESRYPNRGASAQFICSTYGEITK